MGSRVRENPKRLFEFFAEVAKPDSSTDAFILQSYPPDFKEEDVINNVTKFAFPCETDGSAVDQFTFVLTDLESMYKFGFCRHATGAQTCLCIISFLPWFEVFYALLNQLAEVLNRSDKNIIDPLLRAAYVQDIGGVGIPITIVAQQEMFSFKTPDPGKLPSIPNSRNLTEYYNAVDCNNMMKIFAGMLNERRILITSKKLSRLTACVHGSEALLYPMHWQHLFIPVLPSHLIDYCSAPMPYLIGVHSSLFQVYKQLPVMLAEGNACSVFAWWIYLKDFFLKQVKIHRSELGDAVIVDADNNTVDSEHDDLEELPSDVVSHLKKVLKSQQSDRIKTSVPLTGDAISKAFLHALIKLIGSYREALDFRDGEPITFNHDDFVQSRPIHMQPFVSKMLHLQIFQQFINERLDMLNTGQGFQDIFEVEASLEGDRLNAQSRYKDWLGNMKKRGKKFQRGSQDAWSDIKKKAGPMVDIAVKSLGNKGQKAYKGFKKQIGKLNKDEQSQIKNFSSLKEQPVTRPITRQTRPSTIVGPELKTSRPQRPPPPRSTSSSSDIGRPTTDKLVRPHPRLSRNYHLLASEMSVDDMDPRLEYNRISINLLEDPDIQNAMRKSASMEMVTPSHGVSQDSLSSADLSSCTDPDAISEVELSGISLTDQPTTSTSPGGGLAVVNQTYRLSATSNALSLEPPVPAPRAKRRHNTGGSDTKSIQSSSSADQPLIHLESPEKPLSVESTQFDPLGDPAPSTSAWKDVSDLQSNSMPTRQASLRRSHAFRSPPTLSSKRPVAADGSDLDIFDPLASQVTLNSTDDSLQSVSDPGDDLMGTWNFPGIVSTPEKTPPKVPPKTYQASQFTNNIGAIGQTSNQINSGARQSVPIGQLGKTSNQIRQSVPRQTVTVGNIKQTNIGHGTIGNSEALADTGLFNVPAGNRTPVYFPSGQNLHTSPILKPQSADKNQNQDPFADLVDLSPGKTKPTPAPRTSWERFDQ